MTNPFEQDDRGYVVLKNQSDQRSIWPDEVKVPDGWIREFGPSQRGDCLNYVDSVWNDLRPRSAREVHAAQSPADVTGAE